MELTEAQYRPIERCLPTQHGNVTLDNLQVLNAILMSPSTAANGVVSPSGSASGTQSLRA